MDTELVNLLIYPHLFIQSLINRAAFTILVALQSYSFASR